MKKIYGKLIPSLILICIFVSLSAGLVSCGGRGGEGEYTYRTYTTALGTNWNPHTWESNADDEILGYISSPFVDISILDSEKGIYQWVYEMATSITDVTAENISDLDKYGSVLPTGQTAADTTRGFVFEIALNPDAKWETGEAIDADDYIESMKYLISPKMKNYRANLYISGESAIAGAEAYYEGKTEDFGTVGLYKVDDYTIRYVTKTQLDFNYFLTACTDTWLVHIPTYEEGLDTSGSLLTTDYHTKKSNTVSYGPYKIDSLQEEKQLVLVRNENWYGWEEDENGELVSYTDFEVDGENVRQYQTTKIIIDVMDESSARSAFLAGNLSEWEPSADDLTAYMASDRLYKVGETYTLSFFFNTDPEALAKMDRSKGNTNSVVISNDKFRKAFSLAIDRAKFCTATGGYNPEYALMNELYFYDIYNDPMSRYRDSEEAMQAVCNIYGVSYGEGTPYPTLEAAYESVTGYNLTEARALMKAACQELVAAGKYTAGANIKILIGWSKGALTSDDNKQITLLNSFINAAAEGSGFGNIVLEGIGNIANRYDAVPNGDYAIGFGAWGGAAFYPFRNFQLYMDPEQYSVNEIACYDPTTETLTLTVGGKNVTKTWQDWSNSMIGSGDYANAEMEIKLAITAGLEEAFLKTYYRIPVCSTTVSSLLSYQLEYYTDTYNVMYDFGGLRLMKYNYDDAQWRAFVKEMRGELDYE